MVVPLVFTTLFLVANVAMATAQRDAKIVNYQYAIEEDGSYESEYETTNGIRSREDGISYPGNEPSTGNYVRSGEYSYVWDGVTYTVTWTADENGYHPKGDHLPDFSHTLDHIGNVAEIEDELEF